jgi:hypothetical protein
MTKDADGINPIIINPSSLLLECCVWQLYVIDGCLACLPPHHGWLHDIALWLAGWLVGVLHFALTAALEVQTGMHDLE